ncbi:MBL fold metallo-hydrolase [Citreicella sp. C3M06]|uniref:MBL fold metallo-hydrolase n=1 Tax=Citreicella sp. C3M06 TaxID=2841564 RepID=UPI001C09DEDF|nr:MBL fold metallo-hydrolase [Citreicella sp. C3M06]MBU2963051.1 MBL fold metallo-hydrolase [Citreicella sp. C3M06]
MQDPQAEFNPVPGEADWLAPGLRRILAPNPSPMTFRGTNSYILGEDEVAVIDPGPDSAEHLDALLAAIGGARVAAVLVTHAHLDHSPLARALAQATGAPVCAFGDALEGRSPIMQRLAASGLAGGGEGVDAAFAPDEVLADGATLSGDCWALEALHTPGHFGNHLCFAWDDTLFSGDLVMGWATSLVSPPDGDIAAFLSSLDKLTARDWSVLHPGHGAPVHTPSERIGFLANHRRAREGQILDALAHCGGNAASIAARIYTELSPALLPAATRNVFAHLVDLSLRQQVTFAGELSENAYFYGATAA